MWKPTRAIAAPAVLAVSAALLAGCGATGGSWAADDLPHTTLTATAVDDTRLHVMSFNVRTDVLIDAHNGWMFRRGMVGDTVRRSLPDVLGTQELTPSQAEDLAAALPEYGFIGAGRHDGRARGEMCGLWYRRDRLSAGRRGHFWLSNDPADPGSKSWGASYPRMVTWAQLRDAKAGRDVFVFNTHFSHKSKRARKEAAELLRIAIQRIAGDAPVVVMGDFNDGEGSTAYTTLARGVGEDTRGPLYDTYRAVHPTRLRGEGTRHGFQGGRGGERIDWILACDAFRPLAAEIDYTNANGRYPSDHFPVHAVLRWNDAAGALARRGGGAGGSGL